MFSILRKPLPPWRAAIPSTLHSQLAGIGQIYLQSSPLFGAVLLLGLYLYRPALALGCLLGVASASATALLARFPEQQRRDGAYGFNGALTGIGLCAFYQLNHALLAWIVVAGVVSALLGRRLQGARLPVLTFPFVVAMWLAAAAGQALGLQQLPAQQQPGGCSLAPLVFVFCGFAQVAFAGLAPIGMLLWAVLARRHWRAALWVLCAALLALAVVAAGDQLWPQAGFGTQSAGIGVNSMLAALALAMHGRPCRQGLAGVVLAAALCMAFASVALPYFTLPFVLATWLLLWLCAPGTRPGPAATMAQPPVG